MRGSSRMFEPLEYEPRNKTTDMNATELNTDRLVTDLKRIVHDRSV